MAVTCAHQANAVPPDLLTRVVGEFNEMPCLRLTLPQAMRLWRMDRTLCEAMLDALVETDFLVRDCRGQFAKKHADY